MGDVFMGKVGIEYVMTETDYWLWLSLKKSMTSAKIKVLLEYFSSPEEIFRASKEKLSSIKCLNRRTISGLSDKNLDRVIEIKRLCKIYGIKVLTYNSPYYPENLRNISAPPYVLYTRSARRINLNKYIRIAIVGNRESTEYGEKIAENFAYDLANNGMVIVSGMAKGIDSAAHRGCINAGGITVAVMGCGLHMAYPSKNKELMEKIIETGIAISEYPPDCKPEKCYFPERNRIISGLSQGIIVAEAPKSSGSLITANYAIDQDRDLFAVPGDINLSRSEGTNNLIKEYAIAVTSARDIFEHYSFENFEIKKIRELQRENGISAPEEYKEARENENIIKQEFYIGLTDEEKHIITKLSKTPVNFEELLELTGISSEKLVSMITMLEIKGKIKTHPGKNFTLNI